MKRAILASLAALLGMGCAQSTVTMLDSSGDPITFKQGIGGRGCIAVSADLKGGVDVIIQQDGSSDWGGVRAIPVLVRAAITAVFGNRDPEANNVEGPSDLQGCAGLFVEDEVEPALDEALEGRLNRR